MRATQECLLDTLGIENDAFLKTQLITYIGNKRSLLPFIETGIRLAKSKLNKERIDFLDLFSGSGVVARMARQYTRKLHCNDLELYSHAVNHCYQANPGTVDMAALKEEAARIRDVIHRAFTPGFIAQMYAPSDDEDIQRADLQRLAALPGVNSLHRTESGLRFVVDSPPGRSSTPDADPVRSIEEQLETMGIRSASRQPFEPSYEDLFVAIVERDRRERAAAEAGGKAA